MEKAKTRIIWGIVIVVIATFLIVRTFRKEEPVVPTPNSVVMVQPSAMGNIKLTTNLVGVIEPADIVYIYPETDDDVTAVNVKTGGTAVTEQMLVEIDTEQVATSKNAMNTAKIVWDNAVSTLNRVAPLHASGFVSDKELEEYQTAAEAKYLQYGSAKIRHETQMEFSHVAPPINGRMEQLDIGLHDMVGPSMQMCAIAGEGGNNVTSYVAEKAKNNLSLGVSVTVVKEGNQHGGSIVEINDMAKASVGSSKIKALVGDQEIMAPGTSMEIQVPPASVRNVMPTPGHCVYCKSRDVYAYIYDQAEGMIHEVPVGVGIFDSENISVLSGFTLDDMVLTTWTSELKEGTKVTLDTGAGKDIRQTDEVESPATGTSAAQQKEATEWV